MRIGVIGTGTIATAVVRGIAGDGHAITVSDRSARNAAALAAEFDSVTVAANDAVVADSDVLMLGLMAGAAADVLAGLPWRAGQQVISFMAGATLDQLAAWVAPAVAGAVVMPFPAIAGGGSPVLAQGDIGLVEHIFARRNTVYALRDAAEMEAALAAQAVLSPVTALVAEAAGWLAPRVTDPEAAERFLRQLVAASLSGSDCASLLDALNTEGGYNQRLRRHMQQAGAPEALRAGLDRLA
jgi:pyrroline-5-carboxylate reductase